MIKDDHICPKVPHEYTENVCKYKSEARHYYSAMVSSLDDAVDQVGDYL